ncbi:MAG: LamG domain-containing protein, partial [Syntrophomonadaceae bacterium]|nr:LamG domain-containing protein [Syntrophomonadaceae bacterium]
MYTPDAAPVIAQVAPQPGSPGALDFDGVHDFVEISHDSSLDPKRQLTLETWFRVDEFKNIFMPIVTKGSGTSAATRSYSLWIGYAGPGKGFLYFTTADGSYEDGIITPFGSIEAGKWYHFAGVMNRDTGRLEAYLNGELVGSGTVRSSNTATHTKPLLIGQTYESAWYISPFCGAIDEVRLWNVARGAQEIRSDMSKTLEGNEGGLVGLWRFNEVSGTVVEDSSTKDNDGRFGSITPQITGSSLALDGSGDYLMTPN